MGGRVFRISAEVDNHPIRVLGLRILSAGSFPDLTPLAPFYSHVAAYDGHGNHGRFASRSVLARYIGPARGCGVSVIRVIVGRHPRVVRTWRYLDTPGATLDTSTMRFGTPAPESPPTVDIGDLPSTG